MTRRSAPCPDPRMLVALVALVAAPGLATAEVVPGHANPWLAGMPDGSTDGGVDLAPDQSPVLANSIDVSTIPGFRVQASGGAFNAPGCTIPPNATCDPPDGGFAGVHGESNGIAGLSSNLNALIGVFLDDSQPDGTPAPPALDFTSSGMGRNFTSLLPLLKQPFFIGDGMTDGGVAQVFHVPAGATRLYLGTLDGSGWFNNSGQLDVVLNATGGHTYVVNSNADRDLLPGFPESECVTGVFLPGSGAPECTLRAAMVAANVAPDHDTIIFDPNMGVDAQGYVTLAPQSPLPAILDSVTIDGTTAPGYDAGDPDQTPIVQIDGAGAGGSAGVQVLGTANGSSIRGLAFYRWSFEGIGVSASSVTIQGCHIGIRNGNEALGTLLGIDVRGGADDNVIGQQFDPDVGWTGRGNVISASVLDGIRVFGSDNLIAGNRIGTDPSGTTTLIPFGGATGNGENGVVDLGTRTSIGGLGTLTSGGTVASGNLISGNALDGILADDQAELTSIYANFIGTNRDGTAALPNGASGIHLRGLLPLVGETGAGRNVISGNGGHGVQVDQDTVAIIEGNAIGTNSAEGAPLGNVLWGIRADLGTAIVLGNTIGGSGQGGVFLSSDGASVLDNYVGTNASGADLGNDSDGILVSGSDNLVGGLANTVGFNATGITVSTGSDNLVTGNFVGTDAAGRDLANGAGIRLNGSPSAIVEANVIGFGTYGVLVDPGSEGSRLRGNYIGTNPQGEDLGSQSSGVDTRSSEVWIGSRKHETSGAQMAQNRNEIAFNGIGVSVQSAAESVSIRGNSIHSNDIGIDLGQDGPTPNDSGDSDVGENGLQNFPVLDASGILLSPGGGSLDVRYLVDTDITEAGYPLQIDFYVADGGGEGIEWVGTDSYPGLYAGSFYDSTITVEPTAALQDGDFIVATAGDFTTGGTSEFSAPVQVVPEPHPVLALAVGLGWLAWVSRRSHRPLERLARSRRIASVSAPRGARRPHRS